MPISLFLVDSKYFQVVQIASAVTDLPGPNPYPESPGSPLMPGVSVLIPSFYKGMVGYGESPSQIAPNVLIIGQYDH